MGKTRSNLMDPKGGPAAPGPAAPPATPAPDVKVCGDGIAYPGIEGRMPTAAEEEEIDKAMRAPASDGFPAMIDALDRAWFAERRDVYDAARAAVLAEWERAEKALIVARGACRYEADRVDAAESALVREREARDAARSSLIERNLALAASREESERLRETLREWKCLACHGHGETDGKYGTSPCKACGETGLSPEARAALASHGETP